MAKVADKIFAFVDPDTVGVKSGRSRDEADEWILRYPDDVIVMPYIGRNGWNTMTLGGAIPDEVIRDAVDESYFLVTSKLPKKRRPEGWDSPPAD